ncbi:MAG: serine acetyltransferase [Muribaculaceae bacterium]|nr:serine acetyltransferase [Muribaculaceae bacterium]
MGLEMNSELLVLSHLLLYNKAFRNVFYFRIRQINKFISFFLSKILKPLPLLQINDINIGGGLFIQHGFATILAAKVVGNNLWINQCVTVGYSNKTDCPIIGNNVTILSGAKVIGNVRIGNNVTIGANAVVVKDVPDNCIVAGVPAKIIKYKEE